MMMKSLCEVFKKVIVFVFLSLPVVLSAQKEIVDTAVFRQIRQAEMQSSQVPLIAYHLTDLAGSRLTNSPGYFRAGNWAVETMKKWGLQNAKLEPWGEYGRGWDAEVFNIAMTAPYAGYIIGYPLPWSSNTNGEIRGTVVELPYFTLMDTNALNKRAGEFKGKIILIARDGKHVADTSAYSTRYSDNELANLKDQDMLTRAQLEGFIPIIEKIQHGKAILKSLGALAVIDWNAAGSDGTVVVQDYSGFKTNSPELLPEATISSEDGFKIKRLLHAGQRVELSLNIKGKFFSTDTRGYNVVAEIPGTDPSLKAQLVMLGGHLDSWNAATGATDNAAGCIVMLEAVRLLDSLHLRPKRTIRIALWGGEEQGLIGSYHYVLNHFGNAQTGIFKPEQAKVSAYFNLDNGTGKIRGIFAQNDTAIVPIFEQWLLPFHDLGAKTVTLANTGSTDHLSFDWVGIPGFEFIQDPLDYEVKTHHSNMDTYDYLRIDDLKQAAVIVASFVYQASVRPDMLPRKKLLKEQFVFDGF